MCILHVRFYNSLTAGFSLYHILPYHRHAIIALEQPRSLHCFMYSTDHVKQVKVTLAGKETKANLVSFGFDWSNNDNPLQFPLTLVPRAPTTFFIVSYGPSTVCFVLAFCLL